MLTSQHFKQNQALLLLFLAGYHLSGCSTTESFIPTNTNTFHHSSSTASSVSLFRPYQNNSNKRPTCLRLSSDGGTGGRTTGGVRKSPAKTYSRQTNNNSNDRTIRSNNNNNRNNDNNNRSTGGYVHGYDQEFTSFNREITQQENAQDLLNVIASRKGALTQTAGGGRLSAVNFSTSIHRIAKHLTNYQSRKKEGNDRAKILSDPRFALLMCGVAEAMLDGAEVIDSRTNKRNQFGARHFANLVWGIAKMEIAPPDTVMPVNLKDAENLLREKSEQVRSMIIEVAKQKASGSSSSTKSWIPALSELCGLLIDTAGSKSLELDSRQFQQQELSNLMWALTTTQRTNEEVFDYVVQSIVSSAENREIRGDALLVPQEWSIPLYCLAKAGVTSGHEEVLLPFVADLMDNEPGFLESFKPQELSNSAWAAASILSKRPQEAKGPASDAALTILRHACRELMRRKGEGYKSQEMTNTAWSMATLGFGISAEQSSKDCHLTHSYTFLPSDDPDGDRLLMEDALKLVLKNMKENLRYFSTQELNNMSWVMARLDAKDEELLEMIGMELSNPKRRVDSQDLSTSLWSMATMEYFNDSLYRSVVARFQSVGARRFKPQELSNTLWALATAGVTPLHLSAFDVKLLPDHLRPTMDEIQDDPVTAFCMEAAEELMRRPEDFKTQEIKDVLWAFSKLQLRHPMLFQSVAEHLVGRGDDPEMSGRGLDIFNSQGLANLAYSFARQAQLGVETIKKHGKNCLIPMTGGRLGLMTTSFLDVGEGLVRKLFTEIATVNIQHGGTLRCMLGLVPCYYFNLTIIFLHCPFLFSYFKDDLGRMTNQDMANTVWACGVLGMKHNQFLSAVNEAMKKRMQMYISGKKGSISRINGQEVSNLIWGMASLNYHPQGMLDVLSAYLMKVVNNDMSTKKIAQLFSKQEICNLAWSVAVIGEYPPKLLEFLYMGIVGVGDNPDPSYVLECYGDDSLDETHINSLMYLQIILDLELGRKNPFALPDDFPMAWTDLPRFSISNGDGRGSSSPSILDEDDMMNSGGDLEINTSQTQEDVSEAFNRIGFGHVDEYILSMEDLAKAYSINMGPYPIDLLSLDLANIQSKIGVELDGPGHFVTSLDRRDEGYVLSNIGHYQTSKTGKMRYKFNWSWDTQEVNGATNLKSRIFAGLGWDIINIAFWEWLEVNGETESQEAYCRSLLSKHKVPK